MGWTGVVIPEDFGGSDFGYRSMGVILEEFGRKLVAAPLIGSAIGAASAITLGGTDTQKGDWLPKIAEGTAVAALALDEGPRYAPEKIALAATKKGSGYSLSGNKTFVLEGLAADVFVVAARTSGKPTDDKGVTLFLVAANAKGLSRKRRELIDSRGYADLKFDNVEVAPCVLGRADNGNGLLTKVLDRVYTSVAAEESASPCGVRHHAGGLKTRSSARSSAPSRRCSTAANLFTPIQLARPTVEGDRDRPV